MAIERRRARAARHGSFCSCAPHARSSTQGRPHTGTADESSGWRPEECMSDAPPPDTIVLVHGFWVTPRSWEDWIDALRGQGLARARPGLPRVRGRGRGAERRPHADRGADGPGDHRAPRGDRRRARIAADHHRPLRRRRVHPDPARPRLRRRRRGDQLGADRGGQAHPAVAGPRQRSRCSRTRRTATRPSASPSSSGTTPFTNGFPEDEARRLYERYHIPASGRSSGAARSRTSTGRKDETWVNYENDGRAPLLFISGSADHLMPPSIQRSNAKHYNVERHHRGQGVRGRPHLLPAQPGWEEVADYALDWAPGTRGGRGGGPAPATADARTHTARRRPLTRLAPRSGLTT